MQFKNKEDLLKFEIEREEYYSNWFKRANNNLFEFYKLLFLETFHPKYRTIKKMYDNYNGGWYRGEDGIVYTTSLEYIEDIDPGTVVILMNFEV